MSEQKVTRRDFLNIVWGAAGALAVTELSLAGLRFLSPRTAEGEFGGSFNLGAVDQYPAGSVTPVEAVPFDQGSGQFVCPCHGSAFTADGDVINPPAPRPLDLFALNINEAGEIIVDTGITIERDHPNPEHVVYA
jgi:hypothetical protein